MKLVDYGDDMRRYVEEIIELRRFDWLMLIPRINNLLMKQYNTLNHWDHFANHGSLTKLSMDIIYYIRADSIAPSTNYYGIYIVIIPRLFILNHKMKVICKDKIKWEVVQWWLNRLIDTNQIKNNILLWVISRSKRKQYPIITKSIDGINKKITWS